MNVSVRTAEMARGKWRGILLQLGVPEAALTGKHTACPFCGGKDRFRFDDKERRGTYFCSGCGAGDGMQFAMKFTNEPFKTVAQRIDDILGRAIVPVENSRENDREDLRREAYSLWMVSNKLVEGDLVHQYLGSRGLTKNVPTRALRLVTNLKDGEGGIYPCMLAAVEDRWGRFATAHRTFLNRSGIRKADVSAPRKLMPGTMPPGSAVRLSPSRNGLPLGIAEGIETALAAAELFKIPVWAALNANRLEAWEPPEGHEQIVVFGDNDPSWVGQRAAVALAERLNRRGLSVDVRIPRYRGNDWNDVLIQEQPPNNSENLSFNSMRS